MENAITALMEHYGWKMLAEMIPIRSFQLLNQTEKVCALWR